MSIKQWLLRLQARLRSKQRAESRERQEDFLKALYHYALVCPSEELVEHIRKQARVPRSALPSVVGELALAGYIELNPLRLTPSGRERVLALIRAHRIYEKYLAEYSGYSPEEWHSRAEEMEHKLDVDEQERIASLLRNPLWDPHGDPIPREDYDLPHCQGFTEELRENQWYEVLHVEDDDEKLYRQINRIGLAQGCIIRLLHRDKQRLRLRLEGEDFDLPSEALASLSLKPLEEASPEVLIASRVKRLGRLREGEVATIVGISPACVGAMRRRLMDLGFVRGSEIQIDMHSPLGNPTAYLVRHTAIALRHDQACHILITPQQ